MSKKWEKTRVFLIIPHKVPLQSSYQELHDPLALGLGSGLKLMRCPINEKKVKTKKMEVASFGPSHFDTISVTADIKRVSLNLFL